MRPARTAMTAAPLNRPRPCEGAMLIELAPLASLAPSGDMPASTSRGGHENDLAVLAKSSSLQPDSKILKTLRILHRLMAPIPDKSAACGLATAQNPRVLRPKTGAPQQHAQNSKFSARHHPYADLAASRKRKRPGDLAASHARSATEEENNPMNPRSFRLDNLLSRLRRGLAGVASDQMAAILRFKLGDDMEPGHLVIDRELSRSASAAHQGRKDQYGTHGFLPFASRARHEPTPIAKHELCQSSATGFCRMLFANRQLDSGEAKSTIAHPGVILCAIEPGLAPFAKLSRNFAERLKFAAARLRTSLRHFPRRSPRAARKFAINPRESAQPHVERSQIAAGCLRQHKRQADAPHLQRLDGRSRNRGNAHQLVPRPQRVVAVPVERRPLADDVQRRHKIAAADLLRRKRFRQPARRAKWLCFQDVSATAHDAVDTPPRRRFAVRRPRNPIFNQGRLERTAHRPAGIACFPCTGEPNTINGLQTASAAHSGGEQVSTG